MRFRFGHKTEMQVQCGSSADHSCWFSRGEQVEREKEEQTQKKRERGVILAYLYCRCTEQDHIESVRYKLLGNGTRSHSG